MTYSASKAASVSYFMPSGRPIKDCRRVGYCCRVGRGGASFGHVLMGSEAAPLWRVLHNGLRH